jgi:hypothetical protein
VVVHEGDGGRDGSKAERGREAFFRVAQSGLGLAARLKVSEGEQHAQLSADFDWLARHHNKAAAGVTRHRQARLHLWDRLARAQAVECELTLFGLLKHVDLVDRAPEHVSALVAGEFQEALVQLDQAQVGQAADHGRRRVGIEGTLEPVLRLDLGTGVVDDEDETIRFTGTVGDDEGADPVGPVEVGIVLVGYHDHDLVDDLTGDYTVDRVVPGTGCQVDLAVQDKVVAVLVDGQPELLQACDAMHVKGGIIGVGDGLIGLEQDHTLGQSGDDLLELGTLRSSVPGQVQ